MLASSHEAGMSLFRCMLHTANKNLLLVLGQGGKGIRWWNHSRPLLLVCRNSGRK